MPAGDDGFCDGSCSHEAFVDKAQPALSAGVVPSVFLDEDTSALLGTDALAHQWPQTLLYLFP